MGLYFVMQTSLYLWNRPPSGSLVRFFEKEIVMTSSIGNWVLASSLVAIGVAFAIAGIYIGDTDDAPGAALLGILLMVGAVAFAVKTVRRKA